MFYYMIQGKINICMYLILDIVKRAPPLLCNSSCQSRNIFSSNHILPTIFSHLVCLFRNILYTSCYSTVLRDEGLKESCPNVSFFSKLLSNPIYCQEDGLSLHGRRSQPVASRYLIHRMTQHRINTHIYLVCQVW
jgi:hypothetical protein